jgi:hypothetical protein
MSCRSGMSGIVWPDGGRLIDQPMQLITAFNVVFECEDRYRKKPEK